MRLSACLIVRNEERYLPGCLESLPGFVDELVIVDTGSTDRSREIARTHNAILIEDPWRDDFSHSRNLALSHATGDWILYIDADERLVARPEHRQALECPDLVAATVAFRAASNLTCYREFRLFRNRTDIRFRGSIHETVWPDIEAVQQREGARVIHSGALIEHEGYEGDLSHKHHRNHDMLKRSVRQWPERLYLWHALGECEHGLGRPAQAEAAYRQGLETVKGRTAMPADAMIFTDLIGLHYDPSCPALEDIDEILRMANNAHDSDPLVMWWTARFELERGERDAARRRLEILLKPGAENANHYVLAYDRRIFGAYSLALLGNCALVEEDYQEAADCFERALSGDPENRELQAKLAFSRARKPA